MFSDYHDNRSGGRPDPGQAFMPRVQTRYILRQIAAVSGHADELAREPRAVSESIRENDRT